MGSVSTVRGRVGDLGKVIDYSLGNAHFHNRVPVNIVSKFCYKVLFPTQIQIGTPKVFNRV